MSALHWPQVRAGRVSFCPMLALAFAPESSTYWKLIPARLPSKNVKSPRHQFCNAKMHSLHAFSTYSCFLIWLAIGPFTPVKVSLCNELACALVYTSMSICCSVSNAQSTLLHRLRVILPCFQTQGALLLLLCCSCQPEGCHHCCGKIVMTLLL